MRNSSAAVSELAIQLADIQARLNDRTPQLSSSSIEDGALLEMDGDGNLVQIIGKQFDGTHGAATVGGPKPPRPSQPICEGGPLLLTISWDGFFATDAGVIDQMIVAPMDFTRIEVHVSKTSGFIAESSSTLIETIETPRGASKTVMLEPGVWYVVFVARSSSGKASLQSQQTSVEVLEPVGADVDIDALREEFTAANQAALDRIGENKTLQDQLATTVNNLRETELPNLTNELTLSKQRLDAVVTDRISPLENGLSLINQSTIPMLTTSINGKNSIQRSTSAAAYPVNYRVGDRWEKWSSLAAGGKLLQTWRHNGSAWIEEAIDPTYLPQVDIGAGTFGSLSGGRLEADSVSVRELLVGIGGNLYPDPKMTDVAGYAASGLEPIGTGKLGRGSYLVPSSTGQSGSYYGLSDPNKRIPVTPGSSYRVTVWVRPATAAPINTLRLYVRTYDHKNTISFASPGSVNNTVAVATSAWYQIDGIVTVPDDAVTMTLGFFTQPEMTSSARFSDPSVQVATQGNMYVNGSVGALAINAREVAAEVGAFVKADIGNLTVSGSTNLNTVVAQRIAANVGSYLSLTTDQLTAGSAALGDAVARKFAAETGSFMKLFANQIFVGQGGNFLYDAAFQDAETNNIRRTNSNGTWNLIPGTTTAGNSMQTTTTTTNTVFQFFRNPAGGPSAARTSEFVAVTPGQVYDFSVDVTTDKSAICRWNLYVLRADGTSAYTGFTQFTGVGRRELKYTYTVPEGAVGVYPAVACLTNGIQWTVHGNATFREKITPSLIVDGLMNGQRIVGASIESNASALRGIKLNDSGLWAWDNSGSETFRLDASTGQVYGRGNFESREGGITARLGTITGSDGVTRASVSFLGSGAGTTPQIFGEGPGGGYGSGSLVALAREQTINSSGRSALVLYGDGGGGKLATEYGPHGNTGFWWNEGVALVRGKIPGYASSAYDQIRSGATVGATVGANNYVTWAYTHNAPPADGIVRIFTTADNATSRAVSASVHSVNRLGFTIRAINATDASTYIGSVYWMGIWVA